MARAKKSAGDIERRAREQERVATADRAQISAAPVADKEACTVTIKYSFVDATLVYDYRKMEFSWDVPGAGKKGREPFDLQPPEILAAVEIHSKRVSPPCPVYRRKR